MSMSLESLRNFEIKNWNSLVLSGEIARADLSRIFPVSMYLEMAETSLFMEKMFSLPLQWEWPTGYSVAAGHSVLREIESLLEWLKKRKVRLSRVGEILDYLFAFPDLIEVIPLAVEAVYRHLPEANLTLCLYTDPEIEDRYPVLYVRLDQYDDSVMERIEAAENEFINILSEKEGWLQITTDFKETDSGHAI